MHNLFKSATKFILLSGLSLLFLNCSKDENSSIQLDQNVTSAEVKTILETDNLSSAADDVLTDIFISNQSGKSSKVEECYTTEYTETGFNLTFDNCSYEGSEKITGSLSVAYTAGEESSFVATYTNFMVGDYEINGTRNFSMSASSESGASFTITGDMTIKLKDGSIIEEIGSKTIGIIFDVMNFENSAVTIVGDWTVKANENTYTVNISTPLEINFGCLYAGKGVMQLNKNGLKVDIDFGDGTCDDLALLIFPDGTEEEISLKD